METELENNQHDGYVETEFINRRIENGEDIIIIAKEISKHLGDREFGKRDLGGREKVILLGKGGLETEFLVITKDSVVVYSMVIDPNDEKSRVRF